MKVNKGIIKGDRSKYQDLLSKYNKALEEIELLKSKLKKKERLNLEFIDLQEKIDLEIEQRVFSHLSSFAKWIHKESGKAENQKLDRRLSYNNDIFDRLKVFEEILVVAGPKYKKLDPANRVGESKMHESKKLFDKWVNDNQTYLIGAIKKESGKTLFLTCNEYLKDKLGKEIKPSSFYKYLGAYQAKPKNKN